MDIDAEFMRVRNRLMALESKATTPAGVSVSTHISERVDALEARLAQAQDIAGTGSDLLGKLSALEAQVQDRLNYLTGLTSDLQAKLLALETRVQGQPASPPPDTPPAA